MSRNIDIDKFLINDENLIDAELLCNEINNAIISYFLDSDRYVYFCPPEKKGASYIFEIGFGHDEDGKGFSEDEQNEFEKKMKQIKKDYKWKQHPGIGLIVTETWVCGKFDYTEDMTTENLKSLVEKVEKAFDEMKEPV